MSRSPWSTLISTDVWPSAAVEKTSDFFVGIVVFRSMSRVITPPSVSTPSERGVTSSRRRSLTSPTKTPPCRAAPIATTSSGLTPLWGSLPKKSRTICWILGMRVWPPTSTTSSICFGLDPGVLQRLPAGADGALEDVVDHLLPAWPA